MDTLTSLYLVALVFGHDTSISHQIIVAYLGPDQIMPLTSFFAAIVGFLMFFWHRVVEVAARCRRFLQRSKRIS